MGFFCSMEESSIRITQPNLSISVSDQASEAPKLTATFDGLAASAAREAAVKAEPKGESKKEPESQQMEATYREKKSS